MSRSSSTFSRCAGLIATVFILYLCYILVSYVWIVTHSATIDCQKIKQEYVSCQLTQRYLLGLWSDKISELQLLGTDVETISEGLEFNSTLYLKTNKGRIKFYRYGLNESTDAPEIDILLHNPRRSSLKITRSWNPLYDPLFMNLIILPLLLYFLNVIYSGCKLFIKFLFLFFLFFLYVIYSGCQSFIKYLIGYIKRLST